MGIFSFNKDAGEKVLEEDKAAKEARLEEKEERAASALERLVRKHNLPIENLDVRFHNRKVTIAGHTEEQASAEKAALVVGNVRGVTEVDNLIQVVKKAPEAKFYTVKSGDSLSKISKEYYGDAMKYNVIFEANKPMLSDPNKIYPGQVLRIPETS